MLLFTATANRLSILLPTIFNERTKHVKLDCHTTRDQLKKGFLNTLHVASTNNLADILTKPLQPGLFQSILSILSLSSLHFPKDGKGKKLAGRISIHKAV